MTTDRITKILLALIAASCVFMAAAVTQFDLATQVKNVLPAVHGGTGLTSTASFCIPGAYQTLTDGATVNWPLNSQTCSNASLLFTTHGGSRTLNVSGLIDGGSYVLVIQQDGTGGEGLALGSGCSWKVANAGAGTIVPSTAANAIDILAWTYRAAGSICFLDFSNNFN